MIIFKNDKLIYGKLEDEWIGYNKYGVRYIGSSSCGILEQVFIAEDGTVGGLYGSLKYENLNEYDIYGRDLVIYKDYAIEHLTYAVIVQLRTLNSKHKIPDKWTQVFDTKTGSMIIDVNYKIAKSVIYDVIDKNLMSFLLKLVELGKMGIRYLKDIDIVHYLEGGGNIDRLQNIIKESITIESILCNVPVWILNFQRISKNVNVRNVKILQDKLEFRCKCGNCILISDCIEFTHNNLCLLCKELYNMFWQYSLISELSDEKINVWSEFLKKWEMEHD